MGYILLAGVFLLALLPISIRNQTAYRKELISRKATNYGISLTFDKEKDGK